MVPVAEEKPLACWAGKDRIGEEVLPSLTVIFRSGGCAWNRCLMCGYRSVRMEGPPGHLEERIRAQLDSGLSPREVIDTWVAERGEQILAVPTREGFNLVGWTLPFVVTALALIILSALLLRRRRRFEETLPASDDLPESERASKEVLALPIFPELTQEEIDHVADTVADFAAQKT